MKNDPLDSLARYERQLNAIEDLVAFHPEFVDVLNPEQRTVFRRYFQPDWDKVDDFRAYRDQLLREDPAIEAAALAALRMFLTAHEIEPEYLLADIKDRG